MQKIFFSLLMFTCIAATSVQAQAKKKSTRPARPAAGTTAASITAGQQVYATYCLSCHQADGGGVPNMNPPLIKTSFVLGDKTKLINILLNGLNGSIDIEGETYTNVMPPLNILKDEDIANVLTYVRNTFGNKAPAVTIAEVKKTRAAAGK